MIKLNGNEIKPTIFPDGTSQVWKIDLNLIKQNDFNNIDWEFDNEAEFLHVNQLVDLVNHYNKDAFIILKIPYMPYARQDKEISNESTFALRSFCKLLNTLDVQGISSIDLHSNLGRDLVPNLINSSPITLIDFTISQLEDPLIVFPDKGAEKRYAIRLKQTYLTIDKSRNQLTGQLSINGITGETSIIKNRNILLVDDLCDRGGTFIQATQYLQQFEPKTINLYTTHGLYSGGLDIIHESGIIKIFNRKGLVSEKAK